MPPGVDAVMDWRAKTELAKDAVRVAYSESTRASEDAGERRFAAAKTGHTRGGRH